MTVYNMYNYLQVELHYLSGQWVEIIDGGGTWAPKSIHPFQLQAAQRSAGPQETTHNSRKSVDKQGARK